MTFHRLHYDFVQYMGLGAHQIRRRSCWIEKGEPITVFLDERHRFTYIDDVMDGIIDAARLNASFPLVLNLCNGKSERTFDIVKMVESMLERKANLTIDTSVIDQPPPCPCSGPLQKLPDLKPRTTIENGMRKSVDWYLLKSQKRFICASECADPVRCIPTFLDDAVSESLRLTEGCDIIVYTVDMGIAKTTLYEPVHNLTKPQRVPSSCYIAFVTRQAKPEIAHSKWKIII